MKMGIKEFRERISEVADGREAVTVTHHGRVVGHYVPVDRRRLEEPQFSGWLAARERFRRGWQAANPDWRERLERMGWDDEGEPFENDPRR